MIIFTSLIELLPHQLSGIVVLQVNYDAKSLNPTDIIGFGLMANTVAWAAFEAAVFSFLNARSLKSAA